MARSVKLDLRGAPPVSGGMRDHIPPGRYRVQIVKVDDTTSKSGKRMWTAAYKVSLGEYAGSNLGDNFVLVDNNGAPSKMGLGRLHNLLLCLDLPVKEAAFNLDLDNLTGRECDVDVSDGKFTDSNGNERATSEVRNYFLPRKANGNGSSAPAAEPEAVESAVPEAELSVEAASELEAESEDLFK